MVSFRREDPSEIGNSREVWHNLTDESMGVQRGKRCFAHILRNLNFNQ